MILERERLTTTRLKDYLKQLVIQENILSSRKKRTKLQNQVESLKPKSTASGLGNPKTKTYIYDDPRFKEMGRDKHGNKIKKNK